MRKPKASKPTLSWTSARVESCQKVGCTCGPYAMRPQLVLTHCFRISGRRQSHYCPEIPDEMSLVAIAQIQSQLCLTDRFTTRELFRCLVQSVALNYPLGTDTDIPRE